MRVLACPNAYKGSLTSIDAAAAISEGLARASEKEGGRSANARLEARALPLADGGDGTLETLVAATGGSIFRCEVRGPLGGAIDAPWGRLGGDKSDVAIIEMARASGLALLPSGVRDPMNSTTFGTGELMLEAVRAGCRKLLVGIGGSATNDGGAGMAAALGAKLLDKNGNEIAAGGAGLSSICSIDMTGWRIPADIEIQVACDVDNPLAGPEGAAVIYGPQKGATAEMVIALNEALAHLGALLERVFGKSITNTAGAGAAGGLGAGLMAFCNALLLPGTKLVLDAVGFEEQLNASDYVITGEGFLDNQTAHGKVIGVVAMLAKKAGKPCVAICGGVDPRAEALLRPHGLTAAFSITNGPMSLDYAVENGRELLADAAERVGRLLLTLSP